MVKSLETLLKRTVLGMTLAIPLFSARHSCADEFRYVSEARTLNNPNMQDPPQKSLVKKEEDNVISIGQYTSFPIKPSLKQPISITLKVVPPGLTGKNIIRCNYIIEDTSKETESLPANRRFFAEDTANSHLYLAIPKGISIQGCYQDVLVYQHGPGKTRREEITKRLALPLEDSDLGKRLSTFNELVGKFGMNSENTKERNALEEHLDILLEHIPGTSGDIAVILKNSIAYKLQKDEEKRKKELEERYPTCTIIALPFHQANGKLLDHTILGRSFSVGFCGTQEDPLEKARLIIPQLSATRQIEGDTQRVSIENLAYEFSLERKCQK